jgi:hypothetical protein
MKFYMTANGVTMTTCAECGSPVRVRADETMAIHEPPPDSRPVIDVIGVVFCRSSRKPV